MKKQRVRPFIENAACQLLCCNCKQKDIICGYCTSVDSYIGEFTVNNHQGTLQMPTEHILEDTCNILDSPFRILRVAESGNVKVFQKLVTQDHTKLNIRDGRGRAPVHQATIKNRVQILEIIVAFNGSLDLRDHKNNTPLHLAVEVEALDALDYLLANGANPGLFNDRTQSPFLLACELNKCGALRVLAKYRHLINVNQVGEHGRNALHIAATADNAECMEILLYDIGACPRKQDKHGFFPIHEAAKHASSNSMEVLLQWGENNGLPRKEMIAFYDTEGNVPLHSAIHSGDKKAVELCLRSGAKISTQQHDLSTPVHLACNQGALEIVKLMFTIQKEEIECCLKSCDLQRNTPLHCAAVFDHFELVEYLLSEGAFVNVLDKERRSPLHLAASRNGWRTMRILIKLGADVNLKDNDQRNALHLLIIHGGELNKILDCGIDFPAILEEKDRKGYTILHYAAKQGHLKNATKLLELGASILSKNNDGENVFHIACRYGRLNTIHTILQMERSNFVINEGDGKGLTPLHIASQEGHVRVVQALMKKGALLHRDHNGRTPFHLAARNGHRETMRLILNVHSHLLNQTDKEGNTALHLAATENHPDAVELLLTMNCKLLYNIKGFSAIDYALQNKFSAIAHVLVNHRTRGDETLAMTSGKNPSIMLGLISKMPEVVTAVLDRCIIRSNNKSDSDQFHIKYQFKWLSLAEPMVEEFKSLERPDDKQSMERKKHLPILNGMVCNGRVELLSHELSQKYLQMKWHAYGKYIHVAHLFIYFIYLAILTNFAAIIVTKDKYERADSARQENVLKDKDKQEKMVASLSTYMWAVIILSCSTGNIIRVYIVMNISSLCMVFPTVCPPIKEVISEFQIASPSASFAVFFSWFYLLLFLQRFDLVGIYVVMFLEILHTLLKVLTIFSILIVAFGLSFYILLVNGHHLSFGSIPISLMRTFSMMFGDLDFLSTFVNPLHNHGTRNTFTSSSEENNPQPQFYVSGGGSSSSSSNSDFLNKRKELSLPYPFPSFLILGIFMVFMPILLMNLLIGLAVGDIESVRRNAQLKRLALQVHLHTTLEKTLPKFILRRVDKEEVIEYPNARKVRLGWIENIFKYLQPKSHSKETDTPEDDTSEVLSTLYDSNTTLLNAISRLENVETLLKLVCQKMEVTTESEYQDEGAQPEDCNPMSEMKTRFKRNLTLRMTKGKRPPQRTDSIL